MVILISIFDETFIIIRDRMEPHRCPAHQGGTTGGAASTVKGQGGEGSQKLHSLNRHVQLFASSGVVSKAETPTYMCTRGHVTLPCTMR